MISHGKVALVSFALIFGFAAASDALETVPCAQSLDAVLGSEDAAVVRLDSTMDHEKEERLFTVSVPGPGLVRWTAERSSSGKLELGSGYCGLQDAGARLLGRQGREVQVVVQREGSFSILLPVTFQGSFAELHFEPLDVQAERFILESPFGGVSYSVLQTTFSNPILAQGLESEEVDPDPTSKSMGVSRAVLLVAERVTAAKLESEEVDPDPTAKLESEEVDPDPTLESEEVDPDPTASFTATAPRRFEWVVSEARAVGYTAQLRWSVNGAAKLESEEVDPDPTVKLESEEVDPDPTAKLESEEVDPDPTLESEEVDPDPTALADTWQSMGWTFPRELGERLLEDPVPFAWWALGLTEMAGR